MGFKQVSLRDDFLNSPFDFAQGDGMGALPCILKLAYALHKRRVSMLLFVFMVGGDSPPNNGIFETAVDINRISAYLAATLGIEVVGGW